MTEPRELIRALAVGTRRSESDVEAFLDEPQRLARDLARQRDEVRERARELHRQISKGELP